MIKKTILALVTATALSAVYHAAQAQTLHRDWWAVDFSDASCPTLANFVGNGIATPAQDEAFLAKTYGDTFNNDPRTAPDGSEVLWAEITNGQYKGKFLQFATSFAACETLIAFDEKQGLITAPNPLQ